MTEKQYLEPKTVLQLRLMYSSNKGRDISQKEMAEIIGINETTYNRAENRRPLMPLTKGKISNAFEYPIEQIIW